jgi:signal transduction histidine kinase
MGVSGPIGAIYGDHRDAEVKFTETHRAMWTALAVHAAAAIENARLFQQVKAEQTKLEAVIRGIEQPVIVTDVDERVVLMNGAAHRVFGTGRTRGTGMLLAELVGHPILSTLLDQARSSGQIGYGEIVAGRDRAFSVSVTPIPGVGLVTVMQDVTSIKELSEMKSEFVAAVSHDLRSPLSTVYSFLDAIEQVGPLSEEQRDFAANARQELTRLLDLTGDLLDLAGLEADIELEMASCDLGDIVTRSAETWRDQVEEQKLVLDVDVPEQELLVYGNVGRLWQVIDNLLSNAIKYTSAGGQIAVRVALEGQEAVLRVRDTGIGIALEDQPYVYDRFYRGHNELAESVQGIGLGLAIVKSVVERHGGRVWLESGPGQGSMFGVALPHHDHGG